MELILRFSGSIPLCCHQRVEMICSLVQLVCCGEECALCKLSSIMRVVAKVALGSPRTSTALGHVAAGIALTYTVILGAARQWLGAHCAVLFLILNRLGSMSRRCTLLATCHR